MANLDNLARGSCDVPEPPEAPKKAQFGRFFSEAEGRVKILTAKSSMKGIEKKNKKLGHTQAGWIHKCF